MELREVLICVRCARLKVNCEAQMPVARKLRESKAR